MNAEQWFARLRAPDCTSVEKSAFETWRSSDPSHADAYAEVARLWTAASGIAERPAILALRREIVERTEPAPRTFSAWRLAWAVPLVIVALVVTGGIFNLKGDSQYRTALGEQRTISLEDGSRVMLDTASSVRVHYEPQARYITLESGQAYFEVAPDARRPFTVTAGNGTVTAIGTEFAVRRTDDDVTVVLVKGAVSVTAAGGDVASNTTVPNIALTAGERVDYNKKGIVAPRNIDALTAVNWTRGDIVFRATPLSDAVAEINRYTARKLIVPDVKLATLRINGVFHVADVDTFLLALKETFDISATAKAGDTIALAK